METNTAQVIELVRPPVRLTKLGESRVLHPYPLESLSILGMGETNVQYIKQCELEGYGNQNGVEVWAANAAAYAFNCDKAWSIHDAKTMRDIWEEYAGKQKHIDNVNVNWMKDLRVPVVLGEAMEEIPNSLEYPLHEVYAEFKDPYFSSTTAFMVAFALLCFKLSTSPKPKVLNLYGTDFNYYGVDNISESGRNCMEYWLGRAAERGVKVFVPPQSMLMDMNTRRRKGVYGYHMQPIAKRDESGEICGLEEFVDPIEYRFDTQLTNLVKEKMQGRLVDAGDDKKNRQQISGTIQLICQTLNISKVELFGILTDKLAVMPKDGKPSHITF